MKTETGYFEPIISVSRQTNSIGLFNGFDLVKPFENYEDEAEALKAAHDWFKSRTIHVPQIKYPMIRKLKIN